MMDYHSHTEAFNYGFHAREEAHRAGIQANFGLRNKQAWKEEESMLRKWRELMINAPILLHNLLFLLFALADIIISWEMIRAVVVVSVIPPQIQFFAVLIFCLLLNAWAAATAHLIGRGWSKDIQDWERWNYIFIKNRSQAPVNIIGDEMRNEINRSRFWAIFSGLVLIGLVGVIVYFRIVILPGLQEATNNEEGTAGSTMISGLSVVMAYLPVAILLGALFTGDYFWYSIRRWQKRFRAQLNMKRFLVAKQRCGFHDRLAVQYAQAAAAKNEPLELIGDLEKSHLRLKYRSQQNDDYLDPLDHIKRIGFTFRFRGSGKPAEGALVYGILPNGAKTGDYRTDEHGRVTLHPDGDFDRLVAVHIERREYVGPFQFNGEHYIDLPEAAEALLATNGSH